MLAQQAPFPEMRPEEAVNRITKFKMKPQIPLGWPREIQNLLHACWREDPYKRPSFPLISKLLKKLWANLAEDLEYEYYEYLRYEDLVCDEAYSCGGTVEAIQPKCSQGHYEDDEAIHGTTELRPGTQETDHSTEGEEVDAEHPLHRREGELEKEESRSLIKLRENPSLSSDLAAELNPEGRAHGIWQGEEEWRKQLLAQSGHHRSAVVSRETKRSHNKGRIKTRRRLRHSKETSLRRLEDTAPRHKSVSYKTEETEEESESETESSDTLDSEETGESGEDERRDPGYPQQCGDSVSATWWSCYGAGRGGPHNGKAGSEETGEEGIEPASGHNEAALFPESPSPRFYLTSSPPSNPRLPRNGDPSPRAGTILPHKSLTPPPASPGLHSRTPSLTNTLSQPLRASSLSTLEDEEASPPSSANLSEHQEEQEETTWSGEGSTSQSEEEFFDDGSSTSSSSGNSDSEIQQPSYRKLRDFIAMMRGRRDHPPPYDVSREGENFLEAIIGFFSNPFVSMWDTIHP